MVPQLSILVPLYKEMVSLKGINHLWGIVIVSATFHLPMAIYMYSNFIKSIPKDLDEAAMIDGCSMMQSFFYVILPCLKSTTVSVVILNGVGIWNDYQFQLYFLQNADDHAGNQHLLYGFQTGSGCGSSGSIHRSASSGNGIHLLTEVLRKGCYGQGCEVSMTA